MGPYWESIAGQSRLLALIVSFGAFSSDDRHFLEQYFSSCGSTRLPTLRDVRAASQGLILWELAFITYHIRSTLIGSHLISSISTRPGGKPLRLALLAIESLGR